MRISRPLAAKGNFPMLNIFIGWDPREHAAYEVAKWSIERRASVPVLVSPLVLSHLGHTLRRRTELRDGKLWCPISQAPMSTEFAISRFCVPLIQTSGWALFADCDVLCLSDIAELFSLADPHYAVQVVKHEQTNGALTKMDGQAQTRYARKNWSSVVLWNCSHPSHNRLTHARLNQWPGRELHAFAWLKDKEVGELPAEWNHLVGVEPPLEGDCAKILHYTMGGPWFEDWPGGHFDELWLEENDRLTASRNRQAVCRC